MIKLLYQKLIILNYKHFRLVQFIKNITLEYYYH